MSTTCLEHRIFEKRTHIRRASIEDYWKSDVGIIRRIDSLAQYFSFKVVNNVFKIVGDVNGALWLRWRDMGDAWVCLQCRQYASGGRRGYYYRTWFMPEMPVHPGCRCQWEIIFREPEFLRQMRLTKNW